MRAICLAISLIFSLVIIAADTDDVLLENNNNVREIISDNDNDDDNKQPLSLKNQEQNKFLSCKPPKNSYNIDKNAAYIETLFTTQEQINPDEFKAWLNRSHNRYRFCLTFKESGAQDKLVLFAEQNGIELEYKNKYIFRAIKHACHDVKSLGVGMLVIGTTACACILIGYKGTIAALVHGLSTNMSNVAEHIYFTGCDVCDDVWNYFNGSFNYDTFSNTKNNCSDFLALAQQNIANISKNCLLGLKQLVFIDSKNFYHVSCYRDGSVYLDKCKVDDILAEEKKAIEHNNFNGVFFSSAGMVAGCFGVCALGAQYCYYKVKLNAARCVRFMKKISCCCGENLALNTTLNFENDNL